MPRYRIMVEYDGTPYVGWQRQENGPTVQGELEKALKGFTQETVKIGGAGRTDTGVHALGQIAHFDLSKKWKENKIYTALNALLKENGTSIAVLNVRVVPDDWDARYSATSRHYLYRILNRLPQPTVLNKRVWWVRYPLNAEAMHKAAQTLVGLHDFTTFRSTQCQSKSPVKTLDKLEVKRVDDEVHIMASARSFLHNQVRSIVGSLKMVGAEQWTESDLAAALNAKDRQACGPVAPACGLYFVRVDYDERSSADHGL